MRKQSGSFAVRKCKLPKRKNERGKARFAADHEQSLFPHTSKLDNCLPLLPRVNVMHARDEPPAGSEKTQYTEIHRADGHACDTFLHRRGLSRSFDSLSGETPCILDFQRTWIPLNLPLNRKGDFLSFIQKYYTLKSTDFARDTDF